MVVRSPLGWDPLPEPPRRRGMSVLVPLLIVFGVALPAFNLTLPYYALVPGRATSVGKLLSVPAEERHPPNGQVLLTTIGLNEVRPVDLLTGWVRDDVAIVDRARIAPPSISDETYRKLQIDVMAESKQTAIAVAMRRLGYEVAENGAGALIQAVDPHFPGSRRLRAGDVITAIDGKPVTKRPEAVAAITARKPGDVLDMTVRRRTGEAKLQVPVGFDPVRGKTALGVLLRTANRKFDLPFDVAIDSANIGGPSAGLAFTLALLDNLTAGELTGGRKIAVTGTIELDGRVGDVGAVTQKTYAVRSAGLHVFVVPAGEANEARAHAGSDLRIIGVSTLEEALDALRSLGGDLSALGPAPALPQD